MNIGARCPPFAIDVTGDSLPDLIFGGFPTICCPSQGVGAWGPPVISTGASATAYIQAKANDVNGDGFLDLFGGNVSTSHAYLGDGAGGFVESAPAPGKATGGLLDYDFDDIDNDGVFEMVGVHGPPSLGVISLVVWKWVLGGWAVHQTLIPSLGIGSNVTLGDFNGDGWVDILYSAQIVGSNPPVVGTHALVNDGTGAAFIDVGPVTNSADYYTRVADVNGDGCDDLLVGVSTASPAVGPTVFLGHPTSVLSAAIPVAYTQPTSFQIHGPGLIVHNGLSPLAGDVDLDGRVDLLWTSGAIGIPSNPYGLQARVLLGRGNGIFGNPPLNEDEFMPASSVASSGLADLDGDGDLDLLVANNVTGSGGFYWGVGWNQAVLGPGSSGAFGVPRLELSSSPSLGNVSFGFELHNAWPGDLAWFALSMQPANPTLTPPGWWLDLGALVLPTPTVGVMTTNAMGSVSFPAPIPPGSIPGVRGLEIHVQWAVRDPGASFPLGANTFAAFSNARKIVVW